MQNPFATILIATLVAVGEAWTTTTTTTTISKSHRLTLLQAHHETRREWLEAISTATVLGILPSASSSHAATTVAPHVVSTTATCDATVSIWKRSNRLVYVLGTAHISQISATLAGQLVRDVIPNAVFVELDLKRVGGMPTTTGATTTSRLQLPSAPPQPTPPPRIIVPSFSSVPTTTTSTTIATADPSATTTVVSEATATTTTTSDRMNQNALNFGAAAIGNAIRGMYGKLNQAGFNPGDEFVTAVREGQNLGADIVLGDRDVEVTLRRLTQALAVTDLNKLLDPNSKLEQSMKELLPTGPQASSQSNDPNAFKDEISTFVEALKTRDRVRKIMAELSEAAPALVQVMLTERDAYMAAGLDTLNEYSIIVAVMGIAHQDGVEQNLQSRGWSQVRPRCKKVL